MISIEQGELIDILPYNFRNDVEARAFSKALKRGMELVYQNMQQIFVHNIDDMTNEMLDYMAIQARVPYYTQGLEIEKKRELIKNAGRWHLTAGTATAVEELVSIIFGFGEIKEWNEYGGEPFHFKIRTNARLQANNIQRLSEMIDKVKNVRSILETVEIVRRAETAEETACYAKSALKNSVKFE